MLQDVHLCTMMFTLNELFSTSITRATAFLLALTESMSSGSWLLVVDSPGSYSEVKLGKGDDSKTKEYPMKWLLDHTLLEVACDGDNSKWTKVVSDDSRWFRLNQQLLKYPIELENMRYQIHLYQRV
jgi:25S rRNA (uracil2843-N3)-methyltransferase